jgi:DNA-binding MarR family transcriptional regulator
MTSRGNPQAVTAADRIHSAAIHLLRSARRVDEETGLSAARLSALSVLVFGGPRTIGALAAAEQVQPPTITALVNGLEQEGLVTRTRSRNDGRVTLVAATAKGRRVMQAGRRRRIEAIARRLRQLDAHEVETVRQAAELLERLDWSD